MKWFEKIDVWNDLKWFEKKIIFEKLWNDLKKGALCIEMQIFCGKPKIRKWVINSMYCTDRFAWNYTKSGRSSCLCHGPGFSYHFHGGGRGFASSNRKIGFWNQSLHEQASLKSWKIKHFQYLMWNQGWKKCVGVGPWPHFADFSISIFFEIFIFELCGPATTLS